MGIGKGTNRIQKENMYQNKEVTNWKKVQFLLYFVLNGIEITTI